MGELSKNISNFDLNKKIEDLLVYGSYLELLTIQQINQKEQYLQKIVADYLYKDVLILQEIRKAPQIGKLLKLIAFQIDSEVSLSELAAPLGIDTGTVARYLNLLEKSFVILSLSGFSRNLKKEAVKNYKYYFYDLGIRNAIIDNFKRLEDRNDLGQLWENFIIVEKIKHLNYSQVNFSKYFWRTYTGAKIAYIEEKEGKLSGFEIK